MRDPQRIQRLLQLIRRIWEESPDIRLGQLLANASIGLENNIFNYEDDKLEADLRDFIHRYCRKT
jgi:hypothetical protein